ncbi:MAG TPA: extracellular solute-binding protein [Chloroflexi bacterium]|nr:extracellular solute-binding protein [Chloroflexota bacterium]
MRSKPARALAVAVLLLLTGCLPQGPSVPSTPTVTPLPPSSPTTTPTATPTLPRPLVTTLVLWVPEELSPYAETEAAALLAQRLEAFNQSQNDLQVETLIKKAHGRGGLLDFLRTASIAAPSVLPDLVVLDLDDLRVAAQAGLLQPMDGLLPADWVEDLYPFAVEMGRVGEQMVGVPLGVEVEHVAYWPALYSTPPVTWTAVLSAGVPFVFPAGGREGIVDDTTLIEYLGAGGRLTDAEGNPSLDEEPLTAVLDFYARGVAAGVISPSTTLAITGTEGCWQALLNGQAGIGTVDSRRFWTAPDLGLVPAPLPSRSGRAVTLARGWTIGLVASDAERQKQAMELLMWLFTPEGYGPWTQSLGYLPTRRGGLAAWTVDEPSRTFLETLLEGARAAPDQSVRKAVGPALQQAVEAVLTGRRTPAEAARRATEAVAQP